MTMNLNEGPVLVARSGALATVTLNRPERNNSLDKGMKELLVTILADIAGDDEVRAVVLTGAGRSFCVGQDLREHAEALRHDASTAFHTVVEHYNPIITSLVTMPKPVVAAVNGHCVGAGLGFALACDLRIVADDAKFATAFAAIGLTGDSGLSATLARAIGTSRANELMLLADPLDAQRAEEWGIANRVVSVADLAHEAAMLGMRLASGPTKAFAESKLAIAATWNQTLGDALSNESAAQSRLGLTADHRQAVKSFLAKETPSFRGN